jgi:streptogramin lyase
MFIQLWRQWTRTKNRGRTLRPRLEILEDRCVMSASIAEFTGVASGSAPFGITVGPDGNVWFTETQGNQIGMMNPTTHAIAEFPIPTASSSPTGITAGPDGNLWFTEAAGNQIGMINPNTHAISEFPVPTAGSQPAEITSGPDGNLWFTEPAANQIANINPSTHVVTELAVRTKNSAPVGIAAGPDGNIWFTENNSNKVSSVNPATHIINEYVTPKGSTTQPYNITAGPDGNMWFTEANGNRVGNINPTTHIVTEFNIPTGGSGARGITAGADGNLWFTESSANKIGELTLPTDTITEIAIPTAGSQALAITSAPGSGLWFTEPGANQIGAVVQASVITTAPVSQSIVAGQNATFTAAASGFPIPTVQWQVSTNNGLNFTPLTNGGVYSGVTTTTLTITGATASMTGYVYEAVFTNGVSPTPSVSTAPVTLTVNNVLSISPPPQGTVGMPYNQTLSISGSTSPFTLFSVNNFNAGGTGLTPADITTNSINGTITVQGTPTAPGMATFTIAVANTGGNSLTQTVTITISPPLGITTLSLPPATAGVLYNQSINVIGGATPYANFAVSNFNGGTTGLTAAAITAMPMVGSFNISATPLGGGTVTFSVDVTDAANVSVARDFSITVNPPLVITPSLPAGTAGTVYHQVLTVSGGGVPYTSLTVTNFNPGATGLTVSDFTASAGAGTITISGTPTAAGTFSFTANVMDAIGAPLTKTYTVMVNPALTITPSLPQGTAGTLYNHTITIAGGSTPYTTFGVTGFSAGGTGLTAANVVANAAAGTMVVNGTPTGAGTLTFTVNVTDSAGSSLTTPFTVTINPAPTIGTLGTTQWTSGIAGFPGALSLSGGTGPFTLSFAGLPTGLSAALVGNTIHISGTPVVTNPLTNGIPAATAAANFPGSVTIHDAAGAIVTRTFTISVNPAPFIGMLTANQWTIGRAGFNGILSVGGGTGGLTVTASSGLPTGLAIALNGHTLGFTGTPTVAGTFAGSVTLHDALGAAITRTFNITINPNPAIGNLTTTQWTAGKSGFTGTMAISPGTAPFTVTGSSGLPPGLTPVVVGSTIRFTGTPTTAGKYTAGTITLQDAAGAVVIKAVSITINPPVVITTSSVPASALGHLYSAALITTGGTGAVKFALTAGSLPPGIQLHSDGTITGLARGMGTFTFTVTATDAVGATYSKQFTLAMRWRL